MAALLLLGILFAIGATAEEIIKAATLALSRRRARKACRWHAYRHA